MQDADAMQQDLTRASRDAGVEVQQDLTRASRDAGMEVRGVWEGGVGGGMTVRSHPPHASSNPFAGRRGEEQAAGDGRSES